MLRGRNGKFIAISLNRVYNVYLNEKKKTKFREKMLLVKLSFIVQIAVGRREGKHGVESSCSSIFTFCTVSSLIETFLLASDDKQRRLNISRLYDKFLSS